MEAIAFWTFVVGLIIALIVIGTMKMRKAKEKKRWEVEEQRKAEEIRKLEKERWGAEKKRLEEEELRLEAEERRKAREREYLQTRKKNQQDYHHKLIVIGAQSLDLFESLPKSLGNIEALLDQAEVNFSDSAFAPFWDSIENAATCLANFDECIRNINSNLSVYIGHIKEYIKREYEDIPPAFPLASQSVDKLGIVGTATAERMKAIVRKAQRNFQFAMIYEQRKTNKILVHGFTNLAQALDQMTGQITASIGSLASSVDVMTSTVNESFKAINSRMGDIHEDLLKEASGRAEREEKALEMLNNIHEDLSEEASERAEREKKALEMLDNIQRGRKPFW